MPDPQVEKLPSGVWSIPVPIPDNPLGYTLVHLLDSDAGPVLVDAGWDDPASLAALEEGLAVAGTELSEVHAVVVTHHHPDHHGLAGRVREASGCWIGLHHEDADRVRRHREMLDDPSESWQDELSEALHAAGAPPDEVAALLAHRPDPDQQLPALPDRELADGTIVDLGDRRVEAVWTPGHSPGHTCFWLDESRQLLAGDHLLPSITPHVGLYEPSEEVDPLGAFLGSLDRVDALAPAEVLPAHQYRFDHVHERIEELRAHHRERVDELLVALDVDTPTSLWDLTAAMTWNRPWEQIPVMMRRVAMSEALAHVQHLVRRGLAEPVPGSATAYRRVPS